MISNLGVPVILLKNDKVLLAKRRNVYGKGLYGLPGGHVDEQESLEHCMARELLEEVGVVPVQFQLLGLVKEWQKTHFFLQFVFVCTKWNGRITNAEPEKSDDWEWFSLNSLPSDVLSGHKAGLELLISKTTAFKILEI